MNVLYNKENELGHLVFYGSGYRSHSTVSREYLSWLTLNSFINSRILKNAFPPYYIPRNLAEMIANTNCTTTKKWPVAQQARIEQSIQTTASSGSPILRATWHLCLLHRSKFVNELRTVSIQYNATLHSQILNLTSILLQVPFFVFEFLQYPIHSIEHLF